MSNRDNIEITLITENDRERMEQVAQMETDVFPDPWSYHEVRSTVRQKHTFCAAAMEGDTLLGYFLCYYVLDECEIHRGLHPHKYCLILLRASDPVIVA